MPRRMSMRQERSRPIVGAALLFLFLSGCTPGTGGLDLASYKYLQKGATWQSFMVCHGYGCLYRSPVTLSGAQWERITAPLRVSAPGPQAERENIAAALMRMEGEVGEAIGTQSDAPGADFIVDDPGQQDCIDETVNTTLYLGFFEAEGLLRHHTVEAPTRRGYFIDARWPHNTAVVHEKKTGDRYVIDTWFHGNGEKAVILPIQTWLEGWSPPGK